MNKAFTKRFALFLSVLLIAVQLSFLQPITTFAGYLEQAVTIMALDEEGKSVLDAQAVQIEEGDTAWDVLEKTGAVLDFEVYSFGNFLTGINGKKGVNGKFWSFIVNGDFANVGASSYEVKHGDHITFIVTNEMEQTNEVTVSAVADDEYVLPETKVKLPNYATAYDAIIKVAKANNVDVKVDIHSEYLSFIDNVANYEKEDNQWWEIQVNGEALQVGALSHQIQPGEHIQLILQSFQTPGDAEDDGDDGKPGENDGNDNESPGDTDDDGKMEEPGKQDPADDDGSETKTPSLDYLQQMKDEVKTLANYVLDNDLASEYGNEWWVWALATAGYAVPDAYFTSVEKVVTENKGNFSSVFDIEKAIIALTAAGIDVEDVAGYNLLDKLATHKNLEKPMINAAIYALIAMNSGDYTVDTEKEKELLALILKSELEKGGWSFFGSEPSVDITAMALIALANYQDNPEVKEATNRALAYLSTEQHDNGGFYDKWNGGYSSESAAQVIVALSLLKTDPTGEQFTKDGNNLIDYLLQFKVADGLYAHVIDDVESNPMATQQALLAWAHYQNYLKPNDDGTPTPNPKPTPEPNPEPNPDPNPESQPSPNPDEDNLDNVEQETETTVTIGDNQKNSSNKQGKKLPNTKTDIFNIIVFGLFILAIGAILLFVQRKYRTE